VTSTDVNQGATGKGRLEKGDYGGVEDAGGATPGSSA
jgi:hypothetical protein